MKIKIDEVLRFHQACKMIELDGVEAYFTCRSRFGPELAGAALVMWLRCQTNRNDGFNNEDIIEEVNQILADSGRLDVT